MLGLVPRTESNMFHTEHIDTVTIKWKFSEFCCISTLSAITGKKQNWVFSVCGNLHNPNLGQKNKNKLPSDDQYNTLQELKINY